MVLYSATPTSTNLPAWCIVHCDVHDVRRLNKLLLVQLFSGLSQRGTFILFTSNKEPSELYKNGLNRQYFMPFVKLIQKQLAVVEVSLL